MELYSSSGEYQVKKAYEQLCHQESNLQQMRHLNFPKQIWSLIRKVKLPLKILSFIIWRLLQDCLLVLPNLSSKGISVTHIYIYIYAPCVMKVVKIRHTSFSITPMARVVWLRSVLPIRTTYRAQSY